MKISKTDTFVLAGHKNYDGVPHALGTHKHCRILLNRFSSLQNWSGYDFLVIKDHNAFASIKGILNRRKRWGVLEKHLILF